VSYPIFFTGWVSPTVVAGAARKRKEEETISYGRGDMDGWEFKIVRSATGRFRNTETLQETCRQEAAAGWELLEKLDDYRLRFKRRTERRHDDYVRSDPYRANVNSAWSPTLLRIIGLLLLISAGGLLLTTGSLTQFDHVPWTVVVIGLLAIVIGVVTLAHHRS